MGTGVRRVLRPSKATKAKAKAKAIEEAATTATEKEAKKCEKLTRKAPKRHQLTKSQWLEWGDGLRVLKNNGYSQPKELSLHEVREHLTVLRLKSIQRAVDSVTA